MILNGVYGHPEVTAYPPLERLERHNNTALRDAIADFQPQLVYVWSLHGLSKSLLFTLRHARRATVFDVADSWIAQDLRLDPWLRWWNAPGAHLARGGLELAGQRSRLDAIAPTRPVRGVDRLPEVYGAAEGPGAAPPDSITTFRFDRLYFCSQALRQRTIEAGFHVSQGDVIYPGVPPDLFFGDSLHFAGWSLLYGSGYSDRPFIRELGSIGDQVEENLPDAHGIAAYSWHVGWNALNQLNGLFLYKPLCSG